MNISPKFSIVVCSINPDKFSALTKNYAHVMGKTPYEVISIHDAKSLSEGYNRGFKQCSGQIIIFCHDDIEILSPDFPLKLERHLQRADVVGPAGTSYLIDGHWFKAGVPHIHGQIGHYRAHEQMQYSASIFDFAKPALIGETLTTGLHALDGLFIAVNRKVMEQMAFDEVTFDGFHGYDIDFTYSAFLRGFTVGAFTDIGMIHFSEGNFDAVFEKYNERFKKKHQATLLPLIPQGDTGARVLYKDKKKLAKSFDVQTRRKLEKKFSRLLMQKSDRPATEPHSAWRMLKVLMESLLRRR